MFYFVQKSFTCLHFQYIEIVCYYVIFLQTEESSTHEKLDFKLHFTCTSYLITTPCYRFVATV